VGDEAHARRLSGFERATLEALATTLVPPGGVPPAGAVELGLPDALEQLVAGLEAAPRRLVRAMLVGFGLSALLGRHPRLFHQLSEAERRAFCAAAASGRFRLRREAFGGLQTLVRLAFASHPEVRSAIGYDGAPLVPVNWDALAAPVRLPVLEHPGVPAELEADVAVVGSGAGGAVAADTLARAGLRVLVLEEGGAVNREDFARTPLLERLGRLYRDGGLTSTIGRPVIALPMGRALGGTTVVNSGTCFRTPEDVLRSWSALGIPAIGPEDMAPLFEEVEAVLGVAPVRDEVLGANGAVFRRGAEALGYRGGPIRRNVRGCHGHGVCVFGCPLDAKQAMHVSYLPRAVEAGATLCTHVRVRRLVVEHGRCVGLEADVLDPSTERVVGAARVRARVVVLAAGAVFTPALLLRQGLGNSSGQLGRNLVIHPGAGTSAEFDEDLRAWQGTLQSYYVDEKLAEGVLLEATFPPPGIGYSAGTLPAAEGDEKDLYQRYPRIASCGSIVSDEGRGRVRPVGRSGVLIRYDLGEADARKVVEAVALAAEIYFAAGAKVVYPMLPGLPAISSPRDVAAIRSARIRPGDLHLSAYHPMGTARMGPDPRRAVVDPFGAVFDVPGLWVLDASILPSSTHVNPQVTVMALARRGAARLADMLL
jgi:choline dehydrogenase-like flavoprotein